MAKFEKRLKAFKLRRMGWSLNSIAKKLDVAKATASEWCKDLKLTQKQKERLLKNTFNAGLRGRMMGAETNRRKKQEYVDFYKKSGKKEIGRLSKRDLLIAGATLYWGEGSKKSKLAFVNSDPDTVKFMLRWFQKSMSVKKEDFMPRIFINDIHRPRINKVLKFWSSFLCLSISQFGNPVFLKRNPKKVYENYDSYYGVLALGVKKSSKLKYCILGLIDAIKRAGVA